MARPWTGEESMAKLEARLALVAPGNVAEIPIAMNQERQEDDTLIWRVDIHIKIPRVTEYTVESWSHSLADALRRVYLRLGSQTTLIAEANRTNETFGVTV